MRMTEDEARQLYLVRAIELEDREGGLVTHEDRAQAEAYARAAFTTPNGQRGDEAFIAKRASFASARLVTRHPGLAALVRQSRWPRWLGIALPVASLIAGFVANEFGTDRRLDLLAVPLLGMIAWNLLIYVWLIVAAVASKKSSADPLHRAIAWLAGFRHRDLDRGSALHRAALAFEAAWARTSARLLEARIARTLHLSAALFAVGVIGGIYLRALVIEYRAGWESTFLAAPAVHALLSLVLGPAAWMTAVQIPPTASIAAMRWTALETGGVSAAPWIILYTTTIVGMVVAPRLLLVAWHGVKAFRLSRRLPVVGREDFYIRQQLRNARAEPAAARITPYAYRPADDTRRQLSAALQSALGDRAEVRFDEAVDYGAEDRWLATTLGDRDDDYHILLFTLAATPEAENHGALAAGLGKRIASDRPGTVLAAILDENPFRAHFAGQAGLDERISSRISAWRAVLAGAGITPLSLDLSQAPDASLARRIEAGLLADGAMHG